MATTENKKINYPAEQTEEDTASEELAGTLGSANESHQLDANEFGPVQTVIEKPNDTLYTAQAALAKDRNRDYEALKSDENVSRNVEEKASKQSLASRADTRERHVENHSSIETKSNKVEKNNPTEDLQTKAKNVERQEINNLERSGKGLETPVRQVSSEPGHNQEQGSHSLNAIDTNSQDSQSSHLRVVHNTEGNNILFGDMNENIREASPIFSDRSATGNYNSFSNPIPQSNSHAANTIESIASTSYSRSESSKSFAHDDSDSQTSHLDNGNKGNQSDNGNHSNNGNSDSDHGNNSNEGHHNGNENHADAHLADLHAKVLQGLKIMLRYYRA